MSLLNLLINFYINFIFISYLIILFDYIFINFTQLIYSFIYLNILFSYFYF